MAISRRADLHKQCGSGLGVEPVGTGYGWGEDRCRELICNLQARLGLIRDCPASGVFNVAAVLVQEALLFSRVECDGSFRDFGLGG